MISSLRKILSGTVVVSMLSGIFAGQLFAQQEASEQEASPTKQEETQQTPPQTQQETRRTEATPSIDENDAEQIVVKRSWRVGATVQAANRPVTKLLITFPVPTDWPEQHVNVYEEQIPDEARKADFRDDDGLRQMVARIPRLDAEGKLEIYVLMDITVRGIKFPERTDHLVIPKVAPRDVRIHLQPSPLIESRVRAVREKTKELTEEIDLPWQKVEALYQFVVGGEIEVAVGREARTVIGAEKTLKAMKGSPEDMTNVFVALCRNIKIPARIVWADGGEYAEFYLQDEEGNGTWFPAVVEGQTEFGMLTNPRVIIQKGDNIKVAEKRNRQRFVVEHVKGSSAGGARPAVRFMRDLLPERERQLKQQEGGR